MATKKPTKVEPVPRKAEPGKKVEMAQVEVAQVEVLPVPAMTEKEFEQDAWAIQEAAEALEDAAWDAAFAIGAIAAKYHEESGGDDDKHDPGRVFSLRRLARESGRSVTLLRQCRLLHQRFGGNLGDIRERISKSHAIALLDAPQDAADGLIRKIETENLSTRDLKKLIQEQYQAPKQKPAKPSAKVIPTSPEGGEEGEPEAVGTGAAAAQTSLEEVIDALTAFIEALLEGEDLSPGGQAFVKTQEYCDQYEPGLRKLMRRAGKFFGAANSFCRPAVTSAHHDHEEE